MEVTRRQLVAGLASSAFIGAVQVVGAPGAYAAVRPTLRRGSSGSAVVTLQRRLADLGYWCGSADGSFGHLTQQAPFKHKK